jgi:L-fuconolactonase
MSMPPKVIDAHHHFWDPARADYPWMTNDVARIRRAFAPEDLRPELQANGVDGTILVQTRSSVAETVEFLEVAAATDFVIGVVGWVDLTDRRVDEALDRLLERSDGGYLVGIRHQVHDEPDPDWLLRADVRRGLAAVAKRGLAYDLLVRSRELPAAAQTVAELSNLRFVIDHIAKPEIGDGVWEPWAGRMRQLAAHRDHVWCKLSGMVTEADWGNWTADQLRPYIREVLDLFGASRCMFGSDWPVCRLAASYGEVVTVLESAVEDLDESGKAVVFGGAALEAYRLKTD